MNFQNNRRFIFLLIGIALLLVIAIAFVVFSLFTRAGSPSGSLTSLPSPTTIIPYSGKAELIKTIPTSNELRVDQLSSIVLYFKDTPPPSITLSLTPQITGTYTRDDAEKTITFIPTTSFTANTRYTAILRANGDLITSPTNTSSSSYSWSFTIGGQQGEAGFSEEETEYFSETLKQAVESYQERKQRLPFITQMPYETTHFTISISAQNDTVTITTNGSTQAEIDTYRSEALDWLRKNGGNPDTLTITYANTTN